MIISIIINNSHICHNKLYEKLHLNFYNPYIISFENITKIHEYLNINCKTILFFVISEITKCNKIIFKNKKYCLNYLFSFLNNKSINYIIFIDFIIYVKKKPFINSNENINILFGTNEFSQNESKMLQLIIKNLKLKCPFKLQKEVFKDLTKNFNH